jgi:hypothetical protein
LIIAPSNSSTVGCDVDEVVVQPLKAGSAPSVFNDNSASCAYNGPTSDSYRPTTSWGPATEDDPAGSVYYSYTEINYDDDTQSYTAIAGQDALSTADITENDLTRLPYAPQHPRFRSARTDSSRSRTPAAR